LQINNFRQRIRGESKYPAPVEETRERVSPSSARNCAQLTAYARATNTPLSPHTLSHTHTQEGGLEGKPNGICANAGEFDQRERFDELAEAYPPAGRERLEQAYRAFKAAIAEESKQRKLAQDAVFREMLEGLLRWKASERWQAGKVHLLKTFFAERLWREKPVADSPRAPTKSEQALMDFRRRLMRDMEEANENTGLVHRAGSG
jgi:hypothetical protein